METAELRDLLVAARVGDQNAWDTIVERFMPLVLSIARRFRLPEKDVEDVSQTVWLRLAENLNAIREPRALPGWISTTTRREALAVIKTARRSSSVDPGGSWMAALPAADSQPRNLPSHIRPIFGGYYGDTCTARWPGAAGPAGSGCAHAG